MEYLWGIDLGGTKIEVAIIDSQSYACVSRKRIPTEASQGYEHVLNQIQTLIEQVETESGIGRPAKIGIGTPGVSDPETSLIRNSNTICLIGKPLIEDLNKRLNVELVAANDANCFALAEAKLGAARGFNVVFGVILGTGVGGGIVIDGKVINGQMGIAGEWGHNVLDPNGEPCYCGKRGCVETILSGPAIERQFLGQFGESLSTVQINELAASGNLQAIEFLDHICEWLGKGLATVVNILDPDVIVLGGGVSNLPCLYTQGLTALHRSSFHDSASTPIVRAELGDSAGVFGAALLSKS